MENLDDTIFYAHVTKGYTPKVIFDSITTKVLKIPIILSPEGMTICVSDKESIQESHSMWETTWDYRKFIKYECKQSGTISINLPGLRKMLKNVKKKDQLTFYIHKDTPNILKMKILAYRTEDSLPEVETVTVPLQWTDYVPPHIPPQYTDENGEIQDAYGRPMIISAGNCQKIKKLTTIAKDIVLTIQENNYISFSSSNTSVMGSNFEYGALKEQSDSLYKKEFDKSLVGSLVKMPSLCEQMEFYAPLCEDYPIKVRIPVTLGFCDVNFYIKDNEQIASMEARKNSHVPKMQKKEPSKNIEPPKEHVEETKTLQPTKKPRKRVKT